MKVYYKIPLNYQMTGHPENFKIELCYFQERLSLPCNIILKLLSPSISYMILAKQLNLKRTYFL